MLAFLQELSTQKLKMARHQHHYTAPSNAPVVAAEFLIAGVKIGTESEIPLI